MLFQLYSASRELGGRIGKVRYFCTLFHFFTQCSYILVDSIKLLHQNRGEKFNFFGYMFFMCFSCVWMCMDVCWREDQEDNSSISFFLFRCIFNVHVDLFLYSGFPFHCNTSSKFSSSLFSILLSLISAHKCLPFSNFLYESLLLLLRLLFVVSCECRLGLPKCSLSMLTWMNQWKGLAGINKKTVLSPRFYFDFFSKSHVQIRVFIWIFVLLCTFVISFSSNIFRSFVSFNTSIPFYLFNGLQYLNDIETMANG